MQARRTIFVIGALAFIAGLASGFVEAVAMAFRRELRRYSLPRHFKQAFLGHSKHHVERVLGPPPTAMMTHAATASTFWGADTWYYPYDPRHQTAVALRFNEDRVVRVEFISI